MFTNILLLVLALLMGTLAPEDVTRGLIANPWSAFAAGVGLWVATLGLFYAQRRFFRRVPKTRMLFLGSLELFICLLVYHFAFVSQKLFYHLPAIVPSSVILFLWIGGVAFMHGCYGGLRAAKQQALFLVPFSLPFLFMTLLMDTLSFTDNWIFLTAASVIAIILIMIFLPALIQFFWRCAPLKDPVLIERFELVCKKANFKHGGIRTWTVMNDAHSAAIIGIVPMYRYVMFTQKILDSFKPEWLDAVLAHEIGHSKHKHLLIYPFITFGMVLFAGLFLTIAFDPISRFFIAANDFAPWPYWTETYELTLFILFAAAVALIFRFLFGFFSRLFERQADLYIFQLGMEAKNMTEALHEIGVLTGNTHNVPNWHHYSIQQRIDFINEASQNRSLIKQHNRKVYICVGAYFILLILTMIGFSL